MACFSATLYSPSQNDCASSHPHVLIHTYACGTSRFSPKECANVATARLALGEQLRTSKLGLCAAAVPAARDARLLSIRDLHEYTFPLFSLLQGRGTRYCTRARYGCRALVLRLVRRAPASSKKALARAPTQRPCGPLTPKVATTPAVTLRSLIRAACGCHQSAARPDAC